MIEPEITLNEVKDLQTLLSEYWQNRGSDDKSTDQEIIEEIVEWDWYTWNYKYLDIAKKFLASHLLASSKAEVARSITGRNFSVENALKWLAQTIEQLDQQITAETQRIREEIENTPPPTNDEWVRDLIANYWYDRPETYDEIITQVIEIYGLDELLDRVKTFLTFSSEQDKYAKATIIYNSQYAGSTVQENIDWLRENVLKPVEQRKAKMESKTS